MDLTARINITVIINLHVFIYVFFIYTLIQTILKRQNSLNFMDTPCGCRVYPEAETELRADPGTCDPGAVLKGSSF